MELYEALRKGVVEVQFTKVNGEVRTMPCTLKSDIIPNYHEPEQKVGPDNVQRVYCIDAEGWRSFRKDSVISWKFLD